MFDTKALRGDLCTKDVGMASTRKLAFGHSYTLLESFCKGWSLTNVPYCHSKPYGQGSHRKSGLDGIWLRNFSLVDRLTIEILPFRPDHEQAQVASFSDLTVWE